MNKRERDILTEAEMMSRKARVYFTLGEIDKATETSFLSLALYEAMGRYDDVAKERSFLLEMGCTVVQLDGLMEKLRE